jgi:hypothetical protein
MCGRSALGDVPECRIGAALDARHRRAVGNRQRSLAYRNTNSNNGGAPVWEDDQGPHTLFTLQRDVTQVLITVYYRTHACSIPEAAADGAAPPHDHSAQALPLLNELVNVIKVSSDIPVTQQFQIIPWQPAHVRPARFLSIRPATLEHRGHSHAFSGSTCVS